jgi:flagellin
MGLSVNNNIAAMNSYRNLSVTDNQMSKSLEKLSSGFRINRAADDAAGLAISEGLRSQIGGLKVAVRNSQDGISVVQTAEGALTEVHSILQRVRDLTVQAGNDSNNAESRANIKTEADSLVSELDRIAQSTNFNGIDLLKGNPTSGNLKFQVGADGDANSQIEVDLNSADVTDVVAALKSGGSTTLGTRFAIATPTAVAGGYTFTSAAGVTRSVDLGAAASYDSVDEVASKLNGDAGFAAAFKATVDKDTNTLKVEAKTGGAVTVAANAAVTGPPAIAAGAGITAAGTNYNGGLNFTSAAAAQTSLGIIDTQIGNVSTARANLGALQNRFEHTINNLNVSVENLSASESRIRDTDMAQEMTNFTRTQILTQAGTSMLAQANQAPQGILKLLG